MKPEKGAKVRVRLHTGEVVEAVYDQPRATNNKEHWLNIAYPHRCVHAARHPEPASDFDFEKVRFVGNPCDLLPVGVSE